MKSAKIGSIVLNVISWILWGQGLEVSEGVILITDILCIFYRDLVLPLRGPRGVLVTNKMSNWFLGYWKLFF